MPLWIVNVCNGCVTAIAGRDIGAVLAVTVSPPSGLKKKVVVVVVGVVVVVVVVVVLRRMVQH